MLILIAVATTAQNKTECNVWRISGVNQLFLPFFADQPSVDGKKFDAAALLENVQADDADMKTWPVITLPVDSLVTSVNGECQLVRMTGFISTDRWTKASVNISTNAIFELSLNGKKVKSQGRPSERPVKIDLTLGTGIHELSLKLISTEKTLRFGADISAATDQAVLAWNTDPGRTLTINDVLEGVSISGARLSPSGKYVLIQTTEVLPGSGKSQSSFRVYDMELNRNLFALRNNALRADWMPRSDRFFYQVDREGTSDVIIYDMKTGTESVAASGLKSPGRIVWSPAEDYFVYSKNEEAEKTGDLKRVFDNDDRIPGTRNRSYLYIYNPGTKLSQPLTAGSQSASLHAISPDGRRVLFSVSRQDYSEVPFSKQTLYELEISTMQLDTIWKDKLYGGSCQYSPDGTQLLVSGGPETFGTIGVKVSEGRIPNSYDTQLFMFDLKTRKAEPLTRNFEPAAGMAHWAPDGKIYLTATERDCVNLYRLDPKKRSFTKIDVPVEVITSADFAENKTVAVLRGTSISTPEKL
ncbi:MAG: hypothetical protein KDB91_08695, partial [Bacteroidales bacterium]|nr:hypothetical protein [Bacteroidales bacterium]